MCNENIAEIILDKLEGTIIADLKSLIAWAEDFDTKTEKGSEYGGLNFTLLLLSLIACETLGYYAEGAKLNERKLFI